MMRLIELSGPCAGEEGGHRLAGIDWEMLSLHEREHPAIPVINPILSIRHANPSERRYQYLKRKAIRTCTTDEVRDALLDSSQVNGPVYIVPAGLDTQPLDYTYMPRATYCMPQIASFGLTEAQAREQGKDVNVGTFNVQANGKALAMGENFGLVKLVVDAKYGELLGGHMIGPEVTELLGELSMTRMLEGTVLELGSVVHAHPSISEMLKEAALGAQGRTIHM